MENEMMIKSGGVTANKLATANQLALRRRDFGFAGI